VLVIAQSQSTTNGPLPMARAEAEVINELLPPDQFIRDPIASSGMKVAEALQSLSEVEVLHLACHGHQDQDDVLNSGFELEDGRLTLGELMKMNIINARLAYLSACETCGTDETRLDEGINLAATMLFVGFKSVIATMWCVRSISPMINEAHALM
jgi:CHAT domain-containing protein